MDFLNIMNASLDAHSNPASFCASTSPLSSPPPDTTFQRDDSDEDEDWADYGDYLNDENLDMEALRGGPTFRTQRKLQVVVNTLKQVRWSFEQFIHAWMNEPRRLKHRRYCTLSQRQRALQRTLVRIPSNTNHHLVSMFTAELDALTTKPYFGRFDHTAQIDNINFDVAFQTIRETAPTWHKILIQLLSNPRAHRASYNFPQTQEIYKRSFTITSIVCHSRAKKRSNYLSSMLDAYLIGSGVKRRVVETLSGLGLCHSYAHGNHLMQTIANHEKVYAFPYIPIWIR